MTGQSQEPLVVVGVDGSEHAEAALAWAVDHARRTGARLEIVTAWRWPASYGVPLAVPGYDPEAEARTVVEKAAASVDLPAERVTTVAGSGVPGQVLVEQARDADLLVVGSRGHGGFTGLLLGSVSTYCVHHATCPVLVVR